MGNFMGYSSATELFTAIGNKIKAKQNAISDLETIRSGAAKGATAVQPATMTEALAAKQDSLSGTQLAAVNSGINNTKVAQIDSSLIQIVDDGAKNIYDPLQANSEFASSNTNTITIASGTKSVTFTLNEDNTITVSGATEGTTPTLILDTGDLSKYSGLKLSGADSASAFLQIEMAGRPYDLYAKDTGTGADITTIPKGNHNFFLRLASNTSFNTPITIKPMICTKPQFDISSNYEPHALGNQYLTPAVIEQVDSGAKNIADFKSTTNCTVNSNGYTISVSGQPSSSATQWIWEGKVAKSGYYTFAVKGTSIPTTVLYNATDDTNVLLYNTGSGGESSGYLAAGKTYKIGAYLNSSTTYSASFDCMLCTKAAFGVSQKFVPYQVPITGAMSVVDKEIVCSSTLTTTGIKFTSTEKAAYRITATAIYYNSIPMKLAIKHKISPSMSQGTLCTAVHVENEDVSLTVSGIRLLDVGGEFEIFAQYASSTNNRFYVLVEKIG